MNNLTTRKIVLGMLMALVLTFSVQGIADALTFSRPSNSGDLQTVFVGRDFTISFSVRPGGNTTAIRNVDGKLVSDDGNTRINSSGYKVVDIGTSEYRISAAARSLIATTSGTLVYKKGSTYETASSSNFVVSNSGTTVYENVELDSKAYQVYDRTGDPNADPPVAYRYATVTAEPDAKVEDADRYHYNQESISILAPTNVDLKKVRSYSVSVSGGTAHTMDEVKNSVDENKLSSGTTSLIYTADQVGTYEIRITDTTDDTDRPGVAEQPLIFTVYVVKDIGAVLNTATTYTGALDGVEYGYNTQDWQLNNTDTDTDAVGVSYFDFDTTDAPVYYSVEGSGRLFVQVASDRKTSLTNSLFTSSDAPVYLTTNNSTNKVTAYVAGNNGKTAIFIFSGTIQGKYPKIEITQGNNKIGATDARLEDYLEVKVTDGNNRPLAGVAVSFTPSDSSPSGSTFIPVPGTTVYTMITDVDLVDEDDPAKITVATSNRPVPSSPIWVQTDRSGVAQVYYQLGDAVGAHQVTADLEGSPIRIFQTFDDITAVSGSRSASLVIVSGNNQRSDADTHDVEDPLVVRVRRPGGYRISNVIIRFTGLIGALEATPGTKYVRTADAIVLPSDRLGYTPTGVIATDNAAIKGSISGQEIFVLTDAHGEAGVLYNSGQLAGAKTVTARVDDELSLEEYNYQIRQVEFGINGGGTPSRPPADEDDTPPPASIVVPPTVTGTAGGTTTLRVTAPANARVTAGRLNDSFLSTNVGSFTRSGTTFTSTLTLPNQVTSYSLTVFVTTAAGTTSHSVTVSTTAAATQTGTLTVAVNPFSGAPGSTATVTVTAADSSAQSANVTVNLTATGGTLSSSSVATGTTGTTTVTLTRGSTVGSENFVTVSGPSGYPSVSGRFVIAGPAPRDMTVGAAAEVDVYDGNNQDGSLNSRLAEPFIVEVVDANDNPVEDARVRFRTTIGSGRFSPRTPRTDEDGFAETTFTPTSTGRIRVVATVAGADSTAAFIVQGGEPADALVKISGDDQSGTPGNALANPFVVEVQDEDGEPLTGHSVTFSVTAGGGSLSETSVTADEDGLAETTLTLGSERGVNSVQASVSGVDPVVFNTSIEAQILVAAANRPVMYWIAGGGLYSLSGAKEAKIAESANGVAVGGGKIYWTSQVNASSGTINSANLDGTGVATVTSIQSVPVGIAVDTAGSKLYWTNSRGRIQRANLNGSSIKNVLLDLSDPTDIVVSNGFIYWTEGGNSVRRVNISGQNTITRDIAVNLDSVGGLAVSGGKVYWTEQTSASAGTVNGADLDGTNFGALATLLSAPMGISVDTAGSKLYWTNARGRIQSANLNGSGIKNVVEGLISPSKLAIGGANTETTTVKAATPAKKDNAKYDVNGDGTVDNTDASLVSAGFDTGNAKYDVNGDGKVSFLDLLLVFDNRDDDAAAAPAIVGMKLNAVQIDRIEEQIDLLIATNDRSPAAMRTLVYMQQLLATARPEKTQLFANYPNPFNPETWLPYELATDTHVKITIYNTQGVVIRTLQFGHQSAGYYTDRDRAAYWDGRNALGEQVASGLYFYQLETDEMSSMRKMVILK